MSKFGKKRIHIVEERQDEDENEDHKDNNRQYLFTIDERGKERPMCKLKMNNSVISILIDSGSGSNVIDETTLRMLKVRPKLKTAKTKIYAFDSKRAIPVIGEFETWIELGGKACMDEFIVVEGTPGNLLSFKTARKLKRI